jgi:hypothetical protein
MSFFGAVRLYVVSADRMARDVAPSDGGFVPFRDGAWALWARMGESGDEMDLPPQVSRFEAGPVESRGETDLPPQVSRVEPGKVHIAHGWWDPA